MAENNALNVSAENVQVAAKRPLLSLAMIVKNESLTLGRILKSAGKVCDELIVVDTGSTDATKRIALEAGATVYDFEWIEDFSAARNFAFSKCTGEWILWLDADDVLPQASINAIKHLKTSLLLKPELRTIFAPYHYEYTAQGQVAVNLNRERFIRNGIGHVWIGRIHETIAAPWEDSVRVENVIVEHRTHNKNLDRKLGRNLRIFESYIDIQTAPLRELFLYGCELQQAQQLDKATVVLEKYLERSAGTIDGVGEKYTVYVKLADISFQNQKPQACMEWCWNCIKLDPTRAEGYTILGAVLFYGGFPGASWPLLAAACQCPLPPPTTSLVVQKLYSEMPMDLMVQSLDKTKSRQPLERYLQIGAGLKEMAARIKFT